MGFTQVPKSKPPPQRGGAGTAFLRSLYNPINSEFKTKPVSQWDYVATWFVDLDLPLGVKGVMPLVNPPSIKGNNRYYSIIYLPLGVKGVMPLESNPSVLGVMGGTGAHTGCRRGEFSWN